MHTLANILVASLVVLSSATSRPPVVLTAGLFNTITQAGEFSVTQAEHLAAFAMAINEINNKTDGLWDDLLPATRLIFAFAPGIFGRLGPAGVLVKLDASVLAGVVGALPNLEVMTFNEIAQERKLPMVHSIATATELGQGDVYPYMSQTIPIDSYIAKIHQSITCGKKLVIIATTDVVGRRAIQELRSGETCEVQLLGVINVESHNFDMTYIVDQVKELGGLWIGLFTPPQHTAAILEQGYELGLFKDNMMFFGLSNDFIQHFSPSTDVAAVMTGYFGAEYLPKYTFGRDPDAIAFASRWSKQPSTAGKMVGGSWVCNDGMDNAQYAYMYRSPTNISMCTGLDFSTYPEDGSTIADNTVLTYDATILLAKAIHLAIEGGLNPNDGDVISDLILNNVSFKGISGKVEMYPGIPQFDYYSKGCRVVGMMFKIVNFHADAYLAGLNPFVPVIGYSSDTNSFAPCPSGRECSYPIFKTNGADKTVPPPDMHADIIIHTSPAITAILFVCSVISFITVGVFTVFTVRNEKAKVVKAAQPAMLYTALFGGMLASARVLVAALHESDLTCQLQNWFGHMAFGVIFGSLFVKSYRVHKLVNCESLKRVKFTSNKALSLVGAITLVFCVIVAVLHAIGHPHLGYIVTLKSNQYTKEELCKLENSDVQTFILVVEFIMIIGGLRLCYLIRNVYDSVNESNLIAAGNLMYCVTHYSLDLF